MQIRSLLAFICLSVYLYLHHFLSCIFFRLIRFRFTQHANMAIWPRQFFYMVADCCLHMAQSWRRWCGSLRERGQIRYWSSRVWEIILLWTAFFMLHFMLPVNKSPSWFYYKTPLALGPAWNVYVLSLCLPYGCFWGLFAFKFCLYPSVILLPVQMHILAKFRNMLHSLYCFYWSVCWSSNAQ